jgi:hypothetical protein
LDQFSHVEQDLHYVEHNSELNNILQHSKISTQTMCYTYYQKCFPSLKADCLAEAFSGVRIRTLAGHQQLVGVVTELTETDGIMLRLSDAD